MFITIEGNDGSGKSTMTQEVAEYFRGAGYDVVVTREPGGTRLGEEIRALLLDPTGDKKDPLTEFLLFMADRRHHVETRIKPALAEGKVVISDRFMDSTYAYQVCGGRLPEATFNVIGQLVMEGFEPDATLMMLCKPEVGLKRVAEARGRPDRFEQEKIDFHYRLVEGYQLRAERNPQRCYMVDAGQSIETVKEAVLTNCAEILRRGKRDVSDSETAGERHVLSAIDVLVNSLPNPIEVYTNHLKQRIDQGLVQISSCIFKDHPVTMPNPETGEKLTHTRKKNCEPEDYCEIMSKIHNSNPEDIAKQCLAVDLSMQLGLCKEMEEFDDMPPLKEDMDEDVTIQ